MKWIILHVYEVSLRKKIPGKVCDANNRITVSPTHTSLPLALLRLLIDILHEPQSLMKQQLFDYGLKVIQTGVTAQTNMSKLYSWKNKDRTKKYMFRLPVAMFRVYSQQTHSTRNYICERKSDKELLRLYRQVQQNQRKNNPITHRGFCPTTHVLPRKWQFVADAIAYKSLGTTIRGAREYRISRPKYAVHEAMSRLKLMQEKQSAVDDLVRDLLSGQPDNEIMANVDKDIRHVLKPMKKRAARAVLQRLTAEENGGTVALVAEIAGCSEKPLQFRQFLLKLCQTLQTMRLSPKQHTIAIELINLTYSLPGEEEMPIADVEADDEDINLKSKVSLEDLSGLAMAKTPQLAMIAQEYCRTATNFANLRKLRIWSMMCFQRGLRRNRQPKILKQHPQIGEYIEAFLRENNCGAEPWRRLDALCVGANSDSTVNKSVRITYASIRDHLASKYRINFSTTTVYYCCALRHARRMQNRRFYELACVTFRRSQRGFNLKHSLDCIWSNAWYQMKDYEELQCRPDVIVINRDDASPFKCDTVECNCRFAQLSAPCNIPLRPRTDFKADGKTDIVTSSYIFPGRKGRNRFAICVIKPRALYGKSAAQHYDDYQMVRHMEALQPVFENDNKFEIVVHRRDGAPDEGPVNYAPKFFLTAEHLKYGQVLTILSVRWPGGSFLNEVERLHGTVKRAENQLFLPSTIWGSNKRCNTPTGAALLKQNMRTAAEMYREFLRNTIHGGTLIDFVHGAEDGWAVRYPKHQLDNYRMAGRKKAAANDREQAPQWQYFKKIRGIMARHEVKTFASRYLYMLAPCYQPGCPHPICANSAIHQDAKAQTWGDDLPCLSQMFYPVPDSKYPWGEPCTRCNGPCRGHFLPPKEAFDAIREDPSCQMDIPPADVVDNYVERVKRTNRNSLINREKERTRPHVPAVS